MAPSIELEDFDAVLFDLDGVMSTTRAVHAAAWKHSFDEFLAEWDAQHGTAVVSSSRNCAAVLRYAGISDLFDTRVDGDTALKLQLPGKPAPDTFLEGARRLGVARAGRSWWRTRWPGWRRAGRARSGSWWGSTGAGTRPA